MSYRVLTVLAVLAAFGVSRATAQSSILFASDDWNGVVNSAPAPDLAPSPVPPPGSPASTAADALVLSAAALGGVWLGAQVPFKAADDDSDLSVWHLLTAPAAATVVVTGAAVLLGHDPGGSLKAALVGAAAGVGVSVLASMASGDDTVVLSYAAVQGVVTALTLR